MSSIHTNAASVTSGSEGSWVASIQPGESGPLVASALDSTPPQGWGRRLRPWLLAAVVAGIIAQIVALSPSSIEEARDISAPIDPSTLIPKEKVTLAPGIPADRVPEYSVDQFNYVSTQGGEKQWNLLAARANLYNKEKLTHARQVKALLYDPDGKITVVTGQEAKFFMNQRDLEVYGNVTTVMPDGFVVHSAYMHYLPNNRLIEIPVTYPVDGQGKDEGGESLSFNSYGLHYAMGKSEIILPTRVHMTVDKPDVAIEQPTPQVSGVPEQSESTRTMIESDHCIIYRDRKFAYFTMNAERPFETRFVRVTQPTLFSKGRTADLNYGDLSAPPAKGPNEKTKSKPLNYIVLHDDVLIEEKIEDGSIRYATGGQADFDAIRDLVILRKFPQVYHEHDTVTGDVIVLHRDTDVVEIEHSNAFSQGEGP